jgi:iron-sulfur cluster assembly accessory protein
MQVRSVASAARSALREGDGNGVMRRVASADERAIVERALHGRDIDHMVTLTQNAGEKLKALLSEEADEGDGLRVQVVPGGCSGFEYQLTFGKPQSDDEVVEQHGVQILIDRFSAPYLFGAEFDYEESFQGAGFVINNPNSSSSCGCGKSFQA